jgi:hypothetical protein
MTSRVIVCAIGLLLGVSANADSRLSMRVSPAVAFAPANLIVKAMIEADTDNRAVSIVAESDSFYRSSEIQLDGDRAPRTTTFEFRSMPGGVYQVTATLLGVNREALRSVRQQVNVISNGGR